MTALTVLGKHSFYRHSIFCGGVVGGLRAQPRLAKEHPGTTALLKGGEVKGFYQSLADAGDAGKEMFSAEPFSVQEVCPPEGDLGFFSHAIDIGVV